MPMIPPASPHVPGTEEKIEVTPDMINRGEEVFMSCRDLMYETPNEVVRWIITAVLGSRVKFLDDQ